MPVSIIRVGGRTAIALLCKGFLRSFKLVKASVKHLTLRTCIVFVVVVGGGLQEIFSPSSGDV